MCEAFPESDQDDLCMRIRLAQKVVQGESMSGRWVDEGKKFELALRQRGLYSLLNDAARFVTAIGNIGDYDP